MANTKTEKFNNMVQVIASDTISAIATSGPKMQVCMYSLCVCMRVCVWVRACVHSVNGSVLVHEYI